MGDLSAQGLLSIITVLLGLAVCGLWLCTQVRREHLLNDTVLQMRHARTRMKRPLKVVFVGEAGVDEGGVAKVLPLTSSVSHIRPRSA